MRNFSISVVDEYAETEQRTEALAQNRVKNFTGRLLTIYWRKQGVGPFSLEAN